MRTTFYHMKQWYNLSNDLKIKYGEFPLFWQDLISWKPYNEVQKIYLKETEQDASNTVKRSSSGNVHSEDTPNILTEHSITSDKPSQDPKAAESKKRRNTRWGEVTQDTQEDVKTKKKSRWSQPTMPIVSGSLLGAGFTQQGAILKSKLDDINRRIVNVHIEAAAKETDPNRSPSPPPQYDSAGKRLNTREARLRAQLEAERNDICEELMKVNPLFRPPAEYNFKSRLSKKIFIPVKEYPTYNFIGLIIGPRGNTQKRMEKETNCRIAIRGKGSVKESNKGKKILEDDSEELHVLITGEKASDIEAAAKQVEELLRPVDDLKNVHKQKQLRELALINGTLRDEDYCHICGEKGHRQWECPSRELSFKPVKVKCAICGDASHPTSDCTQKQKQPSDKYTIEKEYESFMEQLGEKPKDANALPATASVLGGPKITKSYDATTVYQEAKAARDKAIQEANRTRQNINIAHPGLAGAIHIPGVHSSLSIPVGSAYYPGYVDPQQHQWTGMYGEYNYAGSPYAQFMGISPTTNVPYSIPGTQGVQIAHNIVGCTQSSGSVHPAPSQPQPPPPPPPSSSS